MRVSMSVTVPSVVELGQFSVSVLDVLKIIQQLVELPPCNDSEDMFNKVNLAFTRMKGQEYTFEAKVTFYRGDRNDSFCIPLGDTALFEPNFTPPDKCNLEDSFHWFMAEVAKSAYAMTKGEVEELDVDSGPWEQNGTFHLNFIHWG